MKTTRISKGDARINELIDLGWTLDHSATYNGYLPAGTVSPMRPHDGSEYCRVHHGVCTHARTNYYNRLVQVTTVMRKPIPA